MAKGRGRRGLWVSLGVGALGGALLAAGAAAPIGAALLPTPPVTTSPVTVPVTTPPVTTPPVTVPVTTPPVTLPAVPVTVPATTPPVTLPTLPSVVPVVVGPTLPGGRQFVAVPSSGKPGTKVDLVGLGFPLGRRVKVTYMITARYKLKLCKVKVGTNGEFHCPVTIPVPPRSGAPGAHTIVARVLPVDGTADSTTTFTVQQ
jgi:hypothetical protein